MGASAAVVADWFASAGAAEATTEVGIEAAAADTAGTAITATAAESATASGVAAGTGAAAGGSALTSAAVAAGTNAVVSSLLTPKQRTQQPGVAPVIGMPDPLAQQEAQRRKIAEQLGRRGRASTILTSPSDTLGG